MSKWMSHLRTQSLSGLWTTNGITQASVRKTIDLGEFSTQALVCLFYLRVAPLSICCENPFSPIHIVFYSALLPLFPSCLLHSGRCLCLSLVCLGLSLIMVVLSPFPSFLTPSCCTADSSRHRQRPRRVESDGGRFHRLPQWFTRSQDGRERRVLRLHAEHPAYSQSRRWVENLGQAPQSHLISFSPAFSLFLIVTQVD